MKYLAIVLFTISTLQAATRKKLNKEIEFLEYRVFQLDSLLTVAKNSNECVNLTYPTSKAPITKRDLKAIRSNNKSRVKETKIETKAEVQNNKIDAKVEIRTDKFRNFMNGLDMRSFYLMLFGIFSIGGGAGGMLTTTVPKVYSFLKKIPFLSWLP